MSSYTDSYRGFRRQQAQLVDLLRRSMAALEGLEMSHQRAVLERLEQKVRSDTFKIQVTGTFKNGKSTFINGFLGQEILPAYALPCTAVINEVRYGKERKAVLYFRDPLPETLPSQIPAPVMAHMRKHHMKKVPPVVIPYQQIEQYVVIPMGSDPTQMLLESPYEKVVLYWSLPLLQNGVQIIDSPGLNEHATRTRVTMDYLAKADAILFVLSAQSLCSKEEMSFLEDTLAAQGFRDLIFVVNRFDCIPERERPAIMRYAHQKLEGYTTLGAQGIFFTSALDALEAKKSGDRKRLEGSGMVKLELALSRFLIERKGRAKLAQPARQLSQILQQEVLGRILPMHKQMVGTQLEEVKRRYQAAMPRIQLLENQKRRLESRIQLEIQDSREEFFRAARKNILEIVPLVEQWADSYVPSTKLGIIGTKLKAQTAVKEISNHLAQKIQQHQNQWRNTTLLTMLQQAEQRVLLPAKKEVETMLGTMDKIQSDVSGGGDVKKTSLNTVWSFVGVDSAEGLAVNMDSKELARVAAIEVGAGVLLGIFGLLNPAVLCAMVLSVFAIGSKSGGSAGIDKVKKQVVEHMQNSLRRDATDFAGKVADACVKYLQNQGALLTTAVDGYIQDSAGQVQALLSEMSQGKEAAQRRAAAIQDTENAVKLIQRDLDRWYNTVFK